MIQEPNPIFEKNYTNYLRQLDDVDFSLCESVLRITVSEERRFALVPFFNTIFRVSRFGVVDERGNRPDYGTCVVLLKYLLMCPKQVPTKTDWITNRDFKDSGQTQNTGLASYASQTISKCYAGKLRRLKAAVSELGGRPPKTEYPYDISAVFKALPQLPILFLFNDADEQFTAQVSILYERRAASFLDAECRIMVDWYLLEHLKKAEYKQNGGS